MGDIITMYKHLMSEENLTFLSGIQWRKQLDTKNRKFLLTHEKPVQSDPVLSVALD